MVSMVVGIGVLRLVHHRWACGNSRSVLGAVGLLEDNMMPSTRCGRGPITLWDGVPSTLSAPVSSTLCVGYLAMVVRRLRIHRMWRAL